MSVRFVIQAILLGGVFFEPTCRKPVILPTPALSPTTALPHKPLADRPVALFSVTSSSAKSINGGLQRFYFSGHGEVNRTATLIMSVRFFIQVYTEQAATFATGHRFRRAGHNQDMKLWRSQPETLVLSTVGSGCLDCSRSSRSRTIRDSKLDQRTNKRRAQTNTRQEGHAMSWQEGSLGHIVRRSAQSMPVCPESLWALLLNTHTLTHERQAARDPCMNNGAATAGAVYLPGAWRPAFSAHVGGAPLSPGVPKRRGVTMGATAVAPCSQWPGLGRIGSACVYILCARIHRGEDAVPGPASVSPSGKI
ncbi:hypothetical protein HPB51_004924 [Rhipicephalus microplus]|uniref:Secreted protein n=1 Tax=Rhipicephalus microplus TaxID=6941 RepID=A0A9J6EG71_RHIMP|nr:hypothetical protein HPB51_004924 [Rhipicephalus microplus]